jgi:hypothetical protein
MEINRFDAIVRSFTAKSSRRGLLRGASVTALTLAATQLPLAAEAKKKGKKHKKHNKPSPTPTPAMPQTAADAVCPGPSDDAAATPAVDARLAQTFLALASGPLVRAELRLSKPIGSLGDYILRISPTDGAGVPTNIVLAESLVPDVAVPTGVSTVEFTFASPASGVAGTRYALVVTRPGSDKLIWLGHMGNSCEGTTYFSPSINGAFVPLGNIDLIFANFVSN